MLVLPFRDPVAFAKEWGTLDQLSGGRTILGVGVGWNREEFAALRIPLLVVSPYTDAGHISHSYADHVSILKFIEHNWGLPTISSRSRDNLKNPVSTVSNPYVPTNSPAIDDLFDLFDFNKHL